MRLLGSDDIHRFFEKNILQSNNRQNCPTLTSYFCCCCVLVASSVNQSDTSKGKAQGQATK
jgi:hypothetical protein